MHSWWDFSQESLFITIRKISFLLFVIRQYYPKVWKDKFHSHGRASTWTSQVRDALKSIDRVHSNKKDEWEIYLS